MKRFLKLSVPQWLSIVVLSISFFQARDCSGDPTYYDGTFNNSDWQETLFTNGNGGTSGATQISNNGNPGSYFQITTSVNSGASCGAGIYLRNGFFWRPSVQGPIGVIDYSVDLIAIASDGEAEPVIFQNGKIYFGPELYTAVGSWQTLTETNLAATNFAQLYANPNGELGGNPVSNPDFSATGGDIQFGFIVPDSTPSTAYTTVGGVDNYTLIVHPAGKLNIGLTNGLTTLSWVVSSNDYVLKTTPSLNPPAWVAVTNARFLRGEFNTVTNVWTEPARFFHLFTN